MLSCYLIVVVEQAESCGAVLVSVYAHHGLGGGCQWVLQEGFPRFIFCGEGATLATIARLVLENQDRTLTARRKRSVISYCVLTKLLKAEICL